MIHRRGALFDPATRTINAKKFIDELERFLGIFCGDLKKQPWDSTEWGHIITKMNAIAKNCQK